MKQWIKILVVAVVTAVIFFGLGASLARKGTIKALVGAVAETEVVNDVGLVESWDRVEQLLTKGCTKEALELARIEQSLALSSIKRQVGDSGELMAKVAARNPEVAKRAELVPLKGTYTIPTCK